MDATRYLSVQEVSAMWGITKRRIQSLCVSNRIPGAFRLGNMWVIPANASKPKDARVKENRGEDGGIGVIVIRKARHSLKKLVESSINELHKDGASPEATVQTLVVLFASELLRGLSPNQSTWIETCEIFFNHSLGQQVPVRIVENIRKFISEHSMCLDDCLAWVYQFATKKSDVFIYRDTQFFTEKYMISTLVDSVTVDNNFKMFDPACGGGNFLLYTFDRVANNTDGQDTLARANAALQKLYGYEIDQFLAYVGAFNLKYKALSYIGKTRTVTIADFSALHPKVFFPKHESISGFLDVEWDKQCVVNCDSGEEFCLSEVFNETTVVATNPPFRTIKGMPLSQKKFLQLHYPMSKCDMCNAFIERIMNVLPIRGVVAMVTQNSWMYLDSFTPLRKLILSECTIDNIWELGANAFYDLSGEKANVILLTATKEKPGESHEIGVCSIKNIEIEQIENISANGTAQFIHIRQSEILNNTESRFDIVSTGHLKNLQLNCDQYGSFAVPMQGTSTGDAKNLIDCYWKHIGDSNWVLVSKGGGYSRYEGLNSYSVKWGESGEFIRNTKGSAIRNANYFDQTDLVFSDTGTAGLNVRILLPGQIFVASGPGIRVTKGLPLAHLAFLNSRFAAFYVRLLSPKLTIAAGYIGRIPVRGDILESHELEEYAKRCLEAKRRRLEKRPSNYEFAYIKHLNGESISEMAKRWFFEDIEDEWDQLQNEQKIEDIISAMMELSSADKEAIDNYIGKRTIFSDDDRAYPPLCEVDISNVLGNDCFPRRTKTSKKSIGSDGLIEYISQANGMPCSRVYQELKSHFEWFEKKYSDLYIHALIMSALRFKEQEHRDINLEDALSVIGKNDLSGAKTVQAWLETEFTSFHTATFDGKPLYRYDASKKFLYWGG